MDLQKLREAIDGTDIYLLDQILKLNYQEGSKILDVGCGAGRNLKWFYKNNYEIFGIDISEDDITYCKEVYQKQSNHFKLASAQEIPFSDNFFDHVVCNAVLHFANDSVHFTKMFKELIRVLDSKGTLFIRTASNFGLEYTAEHISNGVYKLPDGSQRFLITKDFIENLEEKYNIELIENVKTTLVRDKRSMTTLVLKKP